MSQLKIKQIRGSKPGSILFLGDDYSVNEDFENINWNSQNNELNIGGGLYIKSKSSNSADNSVIIDNSSDVNLLKVKNNGDVYIKGKVSGEDATEPRQFITLGQLSGKNYLTKGNDSTKDFTKISSMTRSEYNSLTEIDPDTLYLFKSSLSPLGYIQYIDSQYTEVNRYVINEGMTKTIPNNLNIINSEGAPETGDTFYDGNVIKLINEHDVYNITLSFKVKSFNTVNNSFLIKFNDTLGTVKQNSKRLPEGANTEFPIEMNFNIIANQDLVTNGGKFSLNALEGDIEIYDISFVINKIFDSNNQYIDNPLPSNSNYIAGYGLDLSGNTFNLSTDIKNDINKGIDAYKSSFPYSIISLEKNYEHDTNLVTLRDKIIKALSDSTGYVTIDARGVVPSLPNGDYLIDGSIVIDKPCKIILPSGNIIYKNTLDEPMFNFTSNSITIEGSGRSASSEVSAAVTKLIMGADAPNNYHIYGRGVSTMTLSSFDLIGVQTSAVDAVYPSIDGKGGVYFEKPNPGTVSGGNTVNQCVIDDLYIEGSYAHGIYLDTAILSRISNTRVSSAGSHGIFIHKGTSISLQNIYVSSANKGGIVMYQHSYSSLINCVAEYSGIGFWLRSCNAINMFASGTEMNKNIGQNIPNTDIPTTDELGNPVIISDVGNSHTTNFWRGHSYCITGGENITMINPYSTNPGRQYKSGYSTQSRHFKIRGNCENITIINPSLTMSSGESWSGRFDFEISEWGGQAPTGFYMKWNPKDGVTVPTTAGKFITDNDHSSESTNILNEASPDAVIFDGQKYYTVDYYSGDTIYDKLDRRTDKSVPTGTYTLLESDVNKYLMISAPCTVTVPNGLAANLEFHGHQVGGDTTDVVEFVTESGGTLNVNPEFVTKTENVFCDFKIRTHGNDVATLQGTLQPDSPA